MEKRNPLKIYETENQAIVNLSDGKIPPQAIDLEEAVLGAMLIDEKGVNEIIELLSPEVFYKRSHQLIYESIERLFRESEPIDLLTVSAQNLVIRAKARIEEIAKQEGLSGVSTGFEKLDKLTSGWQPSDLVIIAARPGMGKTALALSMARNISVQQKIPVAFFSLEMSSVQLITRLISSETGLTSDKLRTGKLADHEWQQLNIKVSDLESSPLFIDDSPSLTIFELRAKARRLASSHGIKLIIID